MKLLIRHVENGKVLLITDHEQIRKCNFNKQLNCTDSCCFDVVSLFLFCFNFKTYIIPTDQTVFLTHTVYCHFLKVLPRLTAR